MQAYKIKYMRNGKTLYTLKDARDRPQKWIHRNDDYCDWLECPHCGYGDEGEVTIERLEDAPSIYCPCCGQRLEGVK